MFFRKIKAIDIFCWIVRFGIRVVYILFIFLLIILIVFIVTVFVIYSMVIIILFLDRLP